MTQAHLEPGSTIHARCPSCGHTGARHLFSLRGAPVMVASVFPTGEEARSVAGGPIDLAGCTACGLLFNHDFDLALAEAGARYESSQAASPHFSAFARDLAEGWVRRYGLQGKHVIEVGFGGGDFMVDLLKAGCAKVTGIDPLAPYARFDPAYSDRVSVEPASFEPRHVESRADALVCRHALEHIPDVAVFLSRVAAWSRHNGMAPVLFEVPAADRIIEECAFWDVFYEHCSYFSLDALRKAFECAGLEVLDLRVTFGNQYLILEARASAEAAERVPRPGQSDAWIASCVEFARRAEHTIARCRQQLISFCADPGGVVIWQGAAKTVSLITAIGADVPLRFAVDQNPGRHGQHLPPSGLRVQAPATLAQARPAHVVLMNPVYFTEVRTQLDAMGLQATKLHTIDTLAQG